MDLSWPPGNSVNDGIPNTSYFGGPFSIQLPTVAFLADRVHDLGEGCFLYKTDLSRGYRQMRVDPNDWPLLGFTVKGKYYFDLCPPFCMRTSALMMQRMNKTVAKIHESKGYLSRPYIDDFGGVEGTEDEARMALERLQGVLKNWAWLKLNIRFFNQLHAYLGWEYGSIQLK